MATRTSSPPGSRSKSTSSSRSQKSGPRTGRGGSSTRSRSTRSRSGQARAPRAEGATRKSKRPAPRAVRNGPGPVSRVFACARPRPGCGLAGDRARPRGHRAQDRQHAPVTSSPSIAATASGCCSSAWRWSSPRRSGGSCPAASWTSPAPSSPARSARSAGSSRCCCCSSAWRNAARPGAQRTGRPAGHRLGRARLRRARDRAHRQRQSAAGARRRRRSAGGRRRGRLRRLGLLLDLLNAVRRGAAAGAARLLRGAGRHRHAALPDPDPAARRRATGCSAGSRPRTTTPRTRHPADPRPRRRGARRRSTPTSATRPYDSPGPRGPRAQAPASQGRTRHR